MNWPRNRHSKSCRILKHQQNIICHETTWQALNSEGSKTQTCRRHCRGFLRNTVAAEATHNLKPTGWLTVKFFVVSILLSWDVRAQAFCTKCLWVLLISPAKPQRRHRVRYSAPPAVQLQQEAGKSHFKFSWGGGRSIFSKFQLGKICIYACHSSSKF